MDAETFRKHYRNLQSHHEEVLEEATSSVIMTHLVRPALRRDEREAKQQLKRGVNTLYNRMIREEVLNYLIGEGYALDVMEAEELIQELVEDALEDNLGEVTGFGRVDPAVRVGHEKTVVL